MTDEVWATCYDTWECPKCDHENGLAESEPDAGDDKFSCLSCGTKIIVKETMSD